MDPISQQLLLGKANTNAVEFVTFASFDFTGSDGSRSLTINGIQSGDLIIAGTGNRTTTPPTLLSGFTSIRDNSVTDPVDRSVRIQWRTATSTSLTINWTGSYGGLWAFRNASSIGSSNTLAIDGSTTTTVSLPNLSGLQSTGTSAILAGPFVMDLCSAVDSPFTLVDDNAGLVLNNTRTFSSESITVTTAVPQLTWAVEILPP